MSREADLRRALMEWYRPRRGAYPWRVRATPYRVLVSEVMLQQTQAGRVVPAFERFVARFPSITALARAPRSEVVREWSGLGYNRRAVALSETARTVVAEHEGRIPRSREDLRRLPGVGPYTAAAVASLAFGEPVAAVDTNVRRVVARSVLGVDGPGVSPGEVGGAAERWIDRGDPGGFNQALMDLGREVCRPVPRCEACPLSAPCRFRRARPPARHPSSRPGPALGASRGAQPTFQGSSRQVRGKVVEALRARRWTTLAGLAREVGVSPSRVGQAVRSLAAEGIVRPGPAATAGRPRGRVALAD
jgi:A/G-specific adenine glycosylase